MTPQELKNSILRLAIEGKLVAQRPEEGTAEDLYRQIQGEKKKLIKAGQIKKEKPLPEITEAEKPFDLPESWMWVRVGNIGSWSAGATPPRTKAEYYNGNIPWLKTGDLNDGYVSEVPESISTLALEKTSVRLNPVGSVLMAMYGATIGKLAILSVPMTTNQACCACIPFRGIYNKYLFYYLMGMRKAFIKMGEGGAQPNISKEKIVFSLIPLPPLAEQKRIVAKIEELLPLIDSYEQAWTKLEDFNKRFPVDMQKSILQMAIQGKLVPQDPSEGTGEELYQKIQAEKSKLISEGKLKKEKEKYVVTEDDLSYDIPESWKWVTFSELFDIGSAIRIHQTDWKTEGIPFLRGRELVRLAKTGNPEAEIFISQELYEQNKAKGGVPQKGDLLVTAVGTLGKVYIVKGTHSFYYKDAYILRYNNYANLYSKYFKYVIESPYIQEFIAQGSMGTTVAQLTIQKAKRMVCPLPPLAEQKRIVAKLEEILPICERLK